jgi:hypothetical protein
VRIQLNRPLGRRRTPLPAIVIDEVAPASEKSAQQRYKDHCLHGGTRVRRARSPADFPQGVAALLSVALVKDVLKIVRMKNTGKGQSQAAAGSGSWTCRGAGELLKTPFPRPNVLTAANTLTGEYRPEGCRLTGPDEDESRDRSRNLHGRRQTL